MSRNTGTGSHMRKNLIVNLASIKELRQFLNVPSESEAVRIAVEDRLLAEKLASAATRMAKRGGLMDVFQRSQGRPGKGQR